METLIKEINNLLEAKNDKIAILEWKVKSLEKENAELKNDIEKYKENEVNRI